MFDQNIPRYFWQNILRYYLLIYSSSYNLENIGCPGFPQFWNEFDLHEKGCNELSLHIPILPSEPFVTAPKIDQLIKVEYPVINDRQIMINLQHLFVMQLG